MRIRNRHFLRIVVCYGGRRCDGRSRTPALRSHRSASSQGGAPALPQPFQQTSIHAAPVAGNPLSDALRGLDLSRIRSAARRTSRIAPDTWVDQCARFHHAVSFLAAAGRSNHRPSGRRDGASLARCASERPTRSSRRRGRHGFGAGGGQHVFRASPAPSRAKAAAVAALVEVGHRGGFGSTVFVVAKRSPRSVERLRQSARGGRNRCTANSHRPGAGRRGVRQREEPYLYPSAARSAKRHSRQAREEKLAHPRGARRNAPGIPVSTLPASRSDRERVLFGQTQALGSRSRAQLVHASAPSPVAWPEFQPVPPEASSLVPEDVNRAKCRLCPAFKCCHWGGFLTRW